MGAAALDPDEVLAMIRALSGVDDPAARAALIGCLDGGVAVAAAASDALAAGGVAARDVCVAALGRPGRVRWAARALARIGPDGAAAIALWRALPGATVETRLAIAAALHRAPRAAPAPMGAWLRDERDDGVTLVLVDTLGRLEPGELDAGTRARLGELARNATSPFVRALATWAALRHGDQEAERLAFELLTDPVAGPALITYVSRRGGALSSLVAGFAPTTGLDPAWEIFDHHVPGGRVVIDRAQADAYWARARAVWATAAEALARGDRETFARQAGEAAVLAAAAGDGVSAGALGRLRAGLLALPVETGSAVEAFAAALRRGPATESPAPSGPAMWLRYLRVLAGELPADHPLIETAAADALSPEALELVIAVLATGPAGATAAMLARWLGSTRDEIERRAGAASALVAIGTLRWRDDRVRANPLLWAAIVGEPSPLELAPSRWALGDTGAAPDDSDGALRVVTAPAPGLARAALAASSRPPLLAPAGIAGVRWAARDARWRSRTLAVELDGPPAPEILEVLGAAPRVLVFTDDRTASWLAAHLGAARPVRVEAARPLVPAVAAAAIAGVLGVAATSLALGHLFAGDLDDLLGGIDLRGEPAAWALGHALRARAAAALGELAITAEQAARSAPVPTPGLGPAAGSVAPLLERVREIFAGASAWAAPPTAVTVTGAPDLATRLAAELATERGLAAADIALDAPYAWRDVTIAIAAIRRFGGVLAIRGIARADDIRIRALAYALQRAQITTIIGLAPGAEIPPPLRKIATQL